MNFIQRKVMTAKSKYAIADFDRVKTEFLDDVVATVEMEETPPPRVDLELGSDRHHNCPE